MAALGVPTGSLIAIKTICYEWRIYQTRPLGLIRFILALSVVIFHSRPIFGLRLVHGFEAVPLFFIISGFYMSLILNGKYASYWAFISNRFLKLFPTYWLCFVIGVILAREQISSVLAQPEWTALDRLYLVGSNALIFGTEFFAVLTKTVDGIEFIGLHDREDPGFGGLLVIGPVWSLSIELLFYVLAPFLLKKTKRGLAALIAFLAFGLAYDLALVLLGASPVPWRYNLFPPSIKYFCLGAIAFRAYEPLKARYVTHRRAVTVLGTFIAIALIAVLVSYQEWPTWLLQYHISTFRIAAALLTLGIGPIFLLTSRLALDRTIGELSYPLYACHFIFTNYFQLAIHPAIPSLAASLLIYLLIVRPLNRVRQGRAG